MPAALFALAIGAFGIGLTEFVVAGILPQQVADAAASVEGAGEIEVTLVWDPPWDMEKMSEDAKLALDMF